MKPICRAFSVAVEQLADAIGAGPVVVHQQLFEGIGVVVHRMVQFRPVPIAVHPDDRGPAFPVALARRIDNRLHLTQPLEDPRASSARDEFG
jgi:hypothetical protein